MSNPNTSDELEQLTTELDQAQADLEALKAAEATSGATSSADQGDQAQAQAPSPDGDQVVEEDAADAAGAYKNQPTMRELDSGHGTVLVTWTQDI